LPTDAALNLEALKLAQEFRNAGISTSVDISDKKVGKKISEASDAFVTFVLVFGEDEMKTHSLTIKNLGEKTEVKGTLSELIANING
jgi:histidyl-tRNA synthetase